MSEDKKDENIVSTDENVENNEKTENQPSVDENLSSSTPGSSEEENKIPENTEITDQENKESTSESPEHQVIHKKDGRLHIYVRQDKYKGELKSKNWVGRLYIDGKQKISSSGTPNLEEAIPILEKWFDDVQAESEKLKKLSEESQQIQTQPQDQTVETVNIEKKPEINLQSQQNIETTTEKDSTNINLPNNNVPSPSDDVLKINEQNIEETSKSKVTNIIGKFKNFKFKKPSLKGIKLPGSPNKSKNNSLNKLIDFFKSKIGQSSVQGEEVIGVELTNKEIRLAQINSNKSNQWVLEKFYTHKIDIPDESSVLENAETVTNELNLALQKSKIDVGNVAISIPVTSAIIRVVSSPLMKEDELQKAIETNSLWENLVQLTDNLDDYSIFHQVINRNEKDNTMDILFVASKLADINGYVSIVKNSG